MRFVLRLTLRDRSFSSLKERPEFTVPGDIPVVVTLEAHEIDPLSVRNDKVEAKPIVFLLAEVDLEPPPKAAAAMRALAAGDEPQGMRLDVDSRQRWGDGLGPPYRFEELPGSLTEFSTRVSSLLHVAARRAFEVIRWRFDIGGPPRPYASRGVEWTEDGETWFSLPTGGSAHLSSYRSGTPLPPDRVVEVQDLLANAAEEPLAHYILRGARTSLGEQNSTALIVAMSAAEIGLKRLIGAVVPDARWLAENAPTPPLIKMLVEYLPTLPLVDATFAPPPEGVIEQLRKGVTMRNEAVHVGARDLDRDAVERVLDAVGDLLWLLDSYVGHRWALSHLKPSTLVEVGLLEPSED